MSNVKAVVIRRDSSGNMTNRVMTTPKSVNVIRMFGNNIAITKNPRSSTPSALAMTAELTNAIIAIKDIKDEQTADVSHTAIEAPIIRSTAISPSTLSSLSSARMNFGKIVNIIVKTSNIFAIVFLENIVIFNYYLRRFFKRKITK